MKRENSQMHRLPSIALEMPTCAHPAMYGLCALPKLVRYIPRYRLPATQSCSSLFRSIFIIFALFISSHRTCHRRLVTTVQWLLCRHRKRLSACGQPPQHRRPSQIDTTGASVQPFHSSSMTSLLNRLSPLNITIIHLPLSPLEGSHPSF